MGKVGYRPKNTAVVGIGKRLDDLMYERDLSACDIAKAADIDRKTIYALMDNRQDIRLSNIVKIANYLNVSLDYLVYGNRQKEESKK